LVCAALSSPLYFLAVWSYATAFWQTADSNMKGWMFFLFPVLLIPPFVPWLKIAFTASLGFALPHPIAKVLVLVSALFFAINTDVTGRDVSGQGQLDVPAIGNMSPAIFKFGIWVLVGVGALVARSTFAKPNKSSEAGKNA
jgi:hypothetical protein